MTIRIFLGVALGILVPALAGAAERYTFDASHTYPNFTVDHLGFSTMYGRFNQTDGHIVMDRKGEGSELFVLIQTDSIDTGHDKRDNHLRNEDFFNVTKFPTMTYRSTKIRWTSETTAQVDGVLTLLGVEKAVPLAVENVRCGRHPFKQVYVCGFSAKGVLKRSQFGMNYAQGAIGDEIGLHIEAEAVREETKGGPRRQ